MSITTIITKQMTTITIRRKIRSKRAPIQRTSCADPTNSSTRCGLKVGLRLIWIWIWWEIANCRERRSRGCPEVQAVRMNLILYLYLYLYTLGKVPILFSISYYRVRDVAIIRNQQYVLICSRQYTYQYTALYCAYYKNSGDGSSIIEVAGTTAVLEQ